MGGLVGAGVGGGSSDASGTLGIYGIGSPSLKTVTGRSSPGCQKPHIGLPPPIAGLGAGVTGAAMVGVTGAAMVGVAGAGDTFVELNIKNKVQLPPPQPVILLLA